MGNVLLGDWNADEVTIAHSAITIIGQ